MSSQSTVVKTVKWDAWGVLHELLDRDIQSPSARPISIGGMTLDREEQTICQALQVHLQILRANRCNAEVLVSLVDKFPQLLQFLRYHCHRDNSKLVWTFGAVVPFESYPYLQQAAWIANDTASSFQIPGQLPMNPPEGRGPYWIAGVQSHAIPSCTVLEDFINAKIPRERRSLSLAATIAMARSFPELPKRPLYVADGSYIIHSSNKRLQIVQVHPGFRTPGPLDVLTFGARFPEAPKVS